MADLKALHEDATRLAAQLRDSPDHVDPATAAGLGIDLLYALDDDADTVALHLVTSLVGFALHVAPEHSSVPEWWSELGHAHGWIAEQTDSAKEYARAIACTFTAVSAPGAPPAVVELAAVDAAHLTACMLELEDVTAERARQLIAALDGISLSWTDALDATYFEFNRAWALRYAYPLTEDIADLRRAADILRRALAAPVLAEAGQDCVGEWELFSLVLEQLYLDGDGPQLLDEALAAAMKVCELLPEGDERLPGAHGVAAGIADQIFWNGDGQAADMLDTAVTSFAAKRALIGLDDDETVSYALLLQVRGCTTEDVPALTAAVEVLETPEAKPGTEMVLAGLHELLIHLVGPQHVWPAIDWATRALSGTDLDPEMAPNLHGTRIIGLGAALEAFGGDEVAARCDADAILAAARTEALGGEDAERAELGCQTAQLRAQWMADRFPLDVGLFRTTLAETADAVLRLRDHADEDRKLKLATVATLLRDIIPVVMGERDPGPLRAALQDESIREVADVDGLLKLAEQRVALQALAENEQPVGTKLQEMVTDILAGMSETERNSKVGALAPLMRALAEVAGAVENGDATTRAAGYQKIIRICDELPAEVASSPFVQNIRSTVAAQLAIGGHDPGQADATIEELERRLDGPWPDDGIRIAENLGHLLRQRDGAGDAARSRELGLRALVEQARRALTRRDQDGSTFRLARLVGDWCRTDGAQDDLVRVVEVELGVTLARGAGADDAGADSPQLSEEDKYALVEPLGPEDIRSVLRDLGFAALVYLVPRRPTTGGIAVVVPADGPVRSARLPLLTEEWFTRNPGADPAALGGWAWLAGGAAVLAAAKTVQPGRTARVALVPVGPLGSVPWAAAWRDTETGRRYLSEDVDLTLAPSPRLLVRASSTDDDRST